MGAAWAGEALLARLREARDLLAEAAALWRPSPFKHPTLPWERDHPELARALRGLGETALLVLEREPLEARNWLARWLPAYVERIRALQAPALPEAAAVASDPALAVGVPARKWSQIQAFAARVPSGDLPVLEWCSGKGHLGRVLAHAGGRAARCVERDARLAHAGRRIAEERELPVAFTVLDALTAPAAALVRPDQLACALHACGDLHLALLRAAAARGTRALAVSPCCYHLTREPTYRPLSRAAQRGAPALERDELRLALQETVTAPPAVQRRRHALSAWRLGFDALQRELRGVDAYLPVPSVRGEVARGDFGGFVRWAAAQKGLALPADLPLEPFETRGRERQAAARRLSLVRHLFRRPLELWLVLDRALFLHEAGYAVALGTFCAREVTPRNLMIRARRER